ncbi:ABC transporter permease [Shouchella shacheensis]|uniref:ABC transporter permease n=1 Tax=Shouchella shacheensis TaxID=1649580 RepID=UPI00074055AF|nr:ABC transporter permease [Shouchella shacheensis]
MNNFWTIVGHTAGRRIKSKTFVWSTAIMMVLVVGLINMNNIMSTFSGDDETEEAQTVAVVEETSGGAAVAELLSAFEEGSFTYDVYEEGTLDEAMEAAEANEYTYVLSLRGEAAQLEAEFYGTGDDFQTAEEVNQDVQRAKEAVVTNELDLNEEELAQIYAPIVFNEQPLSEGEEVQTEEAHMQAYWMVYVLVFAIYLIVITLGSMIATEVATEKSSRVMELIVSSVNPVTQMLGKLVGIGLVGLLNLAVLVGAVFIGTTLSGDDIVQSLLGEVLDVRLLIYALFFIILGYFVYGGIAAMLGALVSRAEEVNQAIQPLIFLAMIAFFIALFGLNTPDSLFIQVLSYVPFFTPQLLFLRIGMGTVPTWEVLLISLILILSAVLINVLAARIYKGGVLMYGKFSFKNGIKQALTMSKKEK